jgi:two-component system, chemotaxis family, protein-glutamate methylesterase/glutaminase
MTPPPIRVLVVDDSAFARKVVREVLANQDGIEVVGTARDGLDALEKIAELAPDVVTLDLVMPNLDGVGVLRALEGAHPRPAIVIVSMADEESELGVVALQLGAFDIVTKPTALATDRLYELGHELRAKVVAAARHSVAPRVGRTSGGEPKLGARASNTRLVVIGASTGGPQALTLLIRALPEDFPVPIAIVLHMPEGYTEAFARRVDAESGIDVMEARDGLVLRPRLAVVARAGMHMTFQPEGDGLVCKLDVRPMATAHKPSVDVMFTSAATQTGSGTLGVVLTGMGNDGLAGCRAIREAGGRVLTEAESSCVVYGMPRAVFDAGFSVASAPLEAMAGLIVQHL